MSLHLTLLRNPCTSTHLPLLNSIPPYIYTGTLNLCPPHLPAVLWNLSAPPEIDPNSFGANPPLFNTPGSPLRCMCCVLSLSPIVTFSPRSYAPNGSIQLDCWATQCSWIIGTLQLFGHSAIHPGGCRGGESVHSDEGSSFDVCTWSIGRYVGIPDLCLLINLVLCPQNLPPLPTIGLRSNEI